MASLTKLSSTILILFVLFLSTLSNASPTPINNLSPPNTPPVSPPNCPRDILGLGVCANLLGGLINVVIGSPPYRQSQCCTLLHGLGDLDAAVCLCTAIRANLLGINLNVPLTLILLLNACDKPLPPNFRCQ